MKKRLGIYGGTFDPIHIGHLIVPEAARQELGLERVLFIPANNPPHKRDKYLSPAKDRYEMTRLAIEDNPGFAVNDIELKRQGVSYTIDTLKELRQIYSPDYELWMIIGGDALLALDTWKNSDEIMGMCNFAVYLRPDSPIEECKAKAETIRRTRRTEIEFVEGPMIGVSSTDIRVRIAAEKSIRYMVMEKVESYIMDMGLYR